MTSYAKGAIFVPEGFSKSSIKKILKLENFLALRFYTEILGFEKMADIPMGPFRWLTVTSPDGIAGVELVLEPMNFPPARVYQKALFEAGMPAIALITQDMDADYKLLIDRGVVFRGEPQNRGVITTVTFEDTCGNLINLVQPHM